MKHYTEFDKTADCFDIQEIKRGKHKEIIKRCNNVFTFDTEASTYYLYCDEKGNPARIATAFDYNKPVDYYKRCKKYGVCYIWMMQVLDEVYYGRQLDELRVFLGIIHKVLGETTQWRVYVQNFPYDWQYCINVINFDEVFAREPRKPMFAISHEFSVEFRDAYVLNMMSLEMVGSKFNLPHAKKVGDLDYNVERLPCTPMNSKELGYCEYDCLVLADYIAMKAKQYGTVWDIPLTQTGEVRRELKEEIIARKPENPWCAMNDWYHRISRMCETSIDDYRELVLCYQGGYTHANAHYAGVMMFNVDSYDFKSSYPAVMVMEKYPSSRFYEVEDDIYHLDIDNYAYIMHLRLWGVKSKLQNTYLSVSKCVDFDLQSAVVEKDNGRVYKVDMCEVWITEQDWLTIQAAYKMEDVEVLGLKRARKAYLPKELINLLARLFEQKEKLGSEIKALKAKGILSAQETERLAVLQASRQYVKQCINGCYGMAVTKYVTDPVEYDYNYDGGDHSGWVPYEPYEDMTDDEWYNKQRFDMQKKLNEVNSHPLLNFAWGVWVSAYARRNLWRAIIALDEGIIYDDTDSMKISEDYADAAREYVKDYNAEVSVKIANACKAHKIDPSKFAHLGEFDYEGRYDKFITYGAKKYAVEKDGELEITVSGVNKKKAVWNKKREAEEGIANKFDAIERIEEFRLEPECAGGKRKGTSWGYHTSGRMIRYYLDDQPKITLTDYLGNTETINQKHATALQPTTYNLGMTDEYDNRIKSAQALCAEY